MGLGSFFSGLISSIVGALNPIAGLIIAALPLITEIVKMLAHKEVEPQEVESGKLAVMAEECADIKPDNYETTSDYIQAIKESIKNDPEKSAHIEEKMKNLDPEAEKDYKLGSAGLAGKVIAEKLGVDEPVKDMVTFLGKAKAMGFDDAGKTISLIQGLNEEGVKPSEVNKYFEGSLRGADFDKADAGIKAALEKINPGLNTEDQKNAAVNGMSAKHDAAMANLEGAS